jgi:hypothetical protein
MMDWIQGERFKGIADHVFAPRVRHKDDYDKLQNTFERGRLKDLDIIYTHTFYAADLFEELDDVDLHLKLVTHNADNNVTMHPPQCITHWYAQNVDVDDVRVSSLPIGLENDRWFRNVGKKEKMEQMLQKPRFYRNLLYVNHHVQNFPEERQRVYDLLQYKHWVTTEKRQNGKGFDEYLTNVYSHWYVACPRGNGMDTHRLWETLYMGSIPIVRRDCNNWFYHDMPILYVDAWEEVTEDLLLDMYPVLQARVWDKRKLTFEYWKNKIRNGK